MKRSFPVSHLLLLALVFALICGCAREAPRPNILVVTLDTTRADRLGCYGYERPTSPHLDRLAADGVVYSRAYSTASWTLPAHASLFTGKLPTSHGARYDPEGPLILTDAIEGPEAWSRFRARGLAQGEETLATYLARAGYRTGAVVAGPWLERVFGLDAGFEHYDDSGITELNGRPAAEVTDAALDWIESLEGKAPFFLFLNYFDAHAPLLPPAEYVRQLTPPGVDPRTLPENERNALLYDAEILYADHHLGRLLDALRDAGLYDDTWIVVTADHGELFGENGRFGHGVSVSEPEVHVPFVVKPPGSDRTSGPGSSDELVQLTDVLPTLLAGLDLPQPEGLQGMPLGTVDHPIVAEAYPLEMVSPNGDWRMSIEGDYKYAWNSGELDGLFDLSTDPYEHDNLLEREFERAEGMRVRLQRYLSGLPHPGPAGPEQTIDPATARGLDNLGYLGGDGDDDGEDGDER